MPYRIDGIVHHIGVKTEQALVTLFNQAPPACIQTAYPGRQLTFEHRGGTRGVDDIEVLSDGQRITGMSVKHHGKSGTFDYINTTEFPSGVAALPAQIAQLKSQHHKKPESLPEVRRTLAQSINATWGNFTSEDIRLLLKRANERNSEWMCIQTTTDCIVVNHNRLEELAVHPYDESVVYQLRAPKSAKSSRQIWRIKDGKETNTHIRLRMALNNGVTAFLGLSTANTTSVLTIKLQQDNVDGLLKQVVLA
jgi:hypothetical protein